MNKNLMNAQMELGKAEAMMHSIENLYMDFDLIPEERQKAERGACTFYAAWDAVKKAAEYLEEYCGDCHVVDVLRTIHETMNLDK